MPELPDLEVIKDYLQGVLPGERVEDVEVLRPLVVRNLISDDFAGTLTGGEFAAVRRRGKFLLLDLDTGEKLVINPMLAGRLQYCEPNRPRQKRTFVILRLSTGLELRYVDAKAMGKIYLTRDLRSIPGFASQGPEALDPQLTLDVFRDRLRKRRGEIKGILTRQTVVAGIGNAYADEILFEAGIYPFRKRPSLSPEEVEGLYRAMRSVLAQAIAVIRERVGDDISVEVRDFLKVHGQGGSPCPRCGTTISEIRARNRLTNFCRTCQPGSMIGG